jgi:hypothetical protein
MEGSGKAGFTIPGVETWCADCLSADAALFAQGRSPAILEKVKRASEELGKTFLAQIKQSHFKKDRLSLCFLDVVTIPNPGISRGFLVVPDDDSKTAAGAYTQAVNSLLNERKSVGDHPVFADGLVGWSEENFDAPGTARKWADWSNVNTSMDRRPSYLSIAVNPKDETLPKQTPTTMTLRVIPISYEDSDTRTDGTMRYGDQNAELMENVGVFMKLLGEQSSVLRSLDGKPLAQVYLVPVCTMMKEEEGGVSYLRYGSFFLGTSKGKVSEAFIKSIRQMVMEQVGAGYLAISRQRQGAEEGLTEARRAFAHQIKAISYAAGSGWLVTPERWEEIKQSFSGRSEFADALAHPKVAPVPVLYQALQSTLRLWSLSYKPDDVFADGRVPSNLGLVAKQAWQYALHNHLIHSSLSHNFQKDVDSVSKAIGDNLAKGVIGTAPTTAIDAFIKATSFEQLNLQKCDWSELVAWKIDRSYFVDLEENIEALTEATDLQYKQLSGILRVLVVACENFINHASTTSTLKLRMVRHGTALFLLSSNEELDSKPRVKAHFTGMRGEDLIAYLCRAFIGSGEPRISRDSGYRVEVPLETIEWLLPPNK